MSEMVFRHLRAAGQDPQVPEGRDVGVLYPDGHTLIGLRSADIAVAVEAHADVGICGSDWIDEQRLRAGTDLLPLGSYAYGRRHLINPVLELIAPRGKENMKPEDIPAGEFVMTEYPSLLKNFFNQLRIPAEILERVQGGPSSPNKFRDWCKEHGVIGIRTVHGGIAAQVDQGFGYGTMVSEGGDTKLEYGITPIATISRISTMLIADRGSYRKLDLRDEIKYLALKLNEGYRQMRGENTETIEDPGMGRRL